MKLIALSRYFGVASVGAVMVAGIPALSAQTAAELNASGLAKTRAGDLAGAVDDFTSAIALNPSDPSLRANRAVAETGQASYVSAINDYTEVIKAKPNQANGYLLRGLTNFLNGGLADAMKDYQKAVELQPKDPTLYLYRGLADDCDNNQEGAKQDFAKVVELTSGGDSETANYAQIYRGLDLRRSGPNADLELQNYDSWKNAWTKTVAAYVSGKLPETDFFKRVGADVSDDKARNREKAEAHYFAGRVHLLNGDVAGAKQNFSASVDLQLPADVERKLAQTELDRLAAH